MSDTGKTTGSAMRGALILPRDEPSTAPAPWLVLHVTGDGCLRRDGVTLLERDDFTPARIHALLKRLRQDALAAGRATLERRAVAEGEFGDVVAEPLLLQVDAEADWKYANALMTACSSRDLAVWRVQLQVLGDAR
ncbi:MAG: hypothetical protein R3F29_01435 [Planctomycetota bacterium]